MTRQRRGAIKRESSAMVHRAGTTLARQAAGQPEHRTVAEGGTAAEIMEASALGMVEPEAAPLVQNADGEQQRAGDGDASDEGRAAKAEKTQ